jgi:hypothetical protein
MAASGCLRLDLNGSAIPWVHRFGEGGWTDAEGFGLSVEIGDNRFVVEQRFSREGADVSPVTFRFGRAPSSAAGAC